MSFPGGSAFTFARDIGEGYQTVTERSFRALTRPEIDAVAFEIDRALRDVRGEQAPPDDLAAIQARNRRIQRLNGALVVLRAYRQKTKT
jgi:hypothetical protein